MKEYVSALGAAKSLFSDKKQITRNGMLAKKYCNSNNIKTIEAKLVVEKNIESLITLYELLSEKDEYIKKYLIEDRISRIEIQNGKSIFHVNTDGKNIYLEELMREDNILTTFLYKCRCT
jgi:hypothetical protein